MLTGVTENEGVKAPRLLLTAVMVTAPVNPLTGVMVKVTPVEVAPEATVTAPSAGCNGEVFLGGGDEVDRSEGRIGGEKRALGAGVVAVAGVDGADGVAAGG